MEAASLLKEAAEAELSRIEANPSIAYDTLTPDELEAAANPSLIYVMFGKAVERLVGRRVIRDASLKSLFEYTGRSPGPDLIGIGRFKGLEFEITTPGQVDSHRAREYGGKLIIITYERTPR
jgi:hypothetical protein